MFKNIILYLLYAVVLVGLTLAIILSFSHSKSPSTPKTNPPASQNQEAKTNEQPKSSQTASSASSHSSSSASLSNTGPGNAIYIFIASTLIASLMHWLVRHHRLYLRQ